MARHRDAPPGSPPAQRVLGLPWLGLVLTTVVVVALVLLLTPPRYAATAAVSAATARDSAAAAVDLTRTDLRARTERAIELDERWRGSIHLSVDHDPQARVVEVRATAGDPRLAALAADTAAALVVDSRSHTLYLASPAAIPAVPEGGIPGWAWPVAGAAVVLASLLEWRQRRRMLRRGAGRIMQVSP